MPRVTSVLVAWMLAGAAIASVQTEQIPLVNNLDIKADRMEIDSNGWRHAIGNVSIHTADHDLQHADKVDFNKDTGEVHARGHIILVQKDQLRWSGDSLDYNYITREGLTGLSEMHASTFAYTAMETHVDSNGMKRLLHARLTTCNKTNTDWDYWIAASEIDFREHDRVTIYNPIWYFEGVPFFYLPYATRDLNHPFGPMLIPGFRSSWGPYLQSTYTYPFYNPPGPDLVTGNSMIDYRALRGLAYGNEVDWTQEEWGNGHIGFYVTHDLLPNKNEDPNLPPIDPNRYRLYLQHEANPTPTDQVLVQADILSDEHMLEDFLPTLYREQSQPDNFIAYTHRGLTYASGVDASGPLNNTFTGVGHAPEGWLKIMPQELAEDSGLYYESDSSAGYLAQQWTNDGTFTNAFEPDTVRIHTLQKLTYPFQLFDTINVVPRAAYDYTFYSHLRDAAGANDGRTNEVRSVFEFGTEASVKWFANYGEYRHIIEPYLDYAIITSPYNVKPGQNYFFDRVDGPREWSDQFGLDGNYEPRQWDGVRPGVRNTVQTKDADGITRTVFDWDVFVAYRVGGQSDTNVGNGLCMEGWDLTYRPDRDVKFRTEGLYDPKDGGRLDQSDTRVTFGEGRDWSFDVDYFTSDPVNPDTLNTLADQSLIPYYSLDPARLASFSVTHRINSIWSANLFTRYDVKGTQLSEVGGYVQYELDCIAFRLMSGYTPAYTRTDNTRGAANYSVAFMVWVKAFQTGYLEKMQGW